MSIKENENVDDDEDEDEAPTPKKPFLLMHAKHNKPFAHTVKVQPNIVEQVEQQFVGEKHVLVEHQVLSEQKIEVEQFVDHVVTLDDLVAHEIAPPEHIVEKPAIIIRKVDIGASRHTTRYEISLSQLEALEKGEELSDSVSL